MTPVKEHRSRVFTSIAVILGNTIAWGDFALYAYFSPVLSKVFFSFATESTALILYFIVFALSFLFRPIGSAIAGAYADKYGRKNTLMYVVVISSILTTLIGILPSYTAVGFIAPLSLTILRILQTMAVAAEPTNSGALLVEHASKYNKGLLTSFVMVGIYLGFLLSIGSFLVITSCLTTDEIEGWGWRLPYLGAFPIGLISALLLLNASESPVFLQHKKSLDIIKNPIRESFMKYPKALWFAFGLSIMMGVGNYFLLGTIPDYLVNIVHLPLFETNLAITIGLIFTVLFIPVMGALSDRFGRKPIAAFGTVGFLLLVFPMLALILTGKLFYVVFSLIIYCFFLAPIAAILPVMIAEIFPTVVRCTAGALGYNIALVLVGGPTPMIIQIILNIKVHTYFNVLFYPGLYLTLIAIMHILFIFFVKESKFNDVAN
ncbi:MFS transporter [Aquicella lusitana]|uniref:MHS family proline/betaine transporter-like MFS transporter n=1 Tax=Aquicella lusitana TaxID=254246 RepID=A0A370H486_9COXI|nr:MFS transporter [Aquicella lusitana]RDI48864.1 MHS family proline/betaine transporter-like MFS transporter [Aquicella lusitana]VVC73292.1 Proline/betaine transporter [Aquicella lusitana]